MSPPRVQHEIALKTGANSLETSGHKSLTDVALRALMKSPPNRQVDVADVAIPGLAARVTPNGRVTWSLRLRVAGEGGQSPRGHRAKGQQYRLTLGTYPGLSIKEARAKAGDFLAQAENGEHPVRALERKAVDRHQTVERVAETFLSEYGVHLRSLPNAKSLLRGYIIPEWGQLPVDSIDERDVAHLLSKVAKGKPDSETGKLVPRPGAAAETRKWGSILYAWAVRSGYAAHNPFEKAKNPVRSKPRQRFLDIGEARAVWKATAELISPWCELLQLLLLTGCRHREIAHARWAWIDLSEARMVVPASMYKTARPFLVALPDKAVSILRIIPKGKEGDCIFSTTSGELPVWSVPRKIIDDLHAAAEMVIGRKIEHFVVHDFRRTVRTHLARLRVPEVVGELVLGHALKGISATYNIYDFEREKKAALNQWVSELRANSKVA